MRRAGPPERFAAREVGLVLLAGVALGIAATWPLVLHLGSRVASDPGDGAVEGEDDGVEQRRLARSGGAPQQEEPVAA